MDEATLKRAMIENEIKAACDKHGADYETLAPILRERAIVVEHGGVPVVAARLDKGRDIPQLSSRVPMTSHEPMGIEEYTEDLKSGGKHDKAFARPEPTGKANDNGLIDGTWTPEEFMQLSPAEQLAVSRRVDPNAGRGRPLPKIDHSQNPSLKALLKNQK